MRPLFRYTKQEKRGILILLFLIALLQSTLLFFDSGSRDRAHPILRADSLAKIFVDSVRLAGGTGSRRPFKPFNPNFISDYKGYLLGMSPEQLDRLYTYRDKGQYVNSPAQFRDITGISDSLLAEISPYFKFPDFRKRGRQWVKRPVNPAAFRDLNKAGEEELQTISGIGPVLSARIVRFRESLGGFLINEQLLDVYGLDPEVGRRALRVFQVKEVPEVKKIALNTANIEELSRLVYLDRKLAQRILAFRNIHGKFDSIEQLTKIEDFPSERIDRIKLYLAL